MIETSLKLNEKETVSSAPKDAQGNLAMIDSPVTFVSSNPTVADAVDMPGAYGSVAKWIVPKKVGTCSITVTALQNTVPSTDQINVTVEPDPIVDMGIVLGTPVPQQ